MHFTGLSGEFLGLYAVEGHDAAALLTAKPSELRIYWNQATDATFEVDGVMLTVQPNELLFLTEYHRFIPQAAANGRLFRFNRPFYCLDNHDHEVGCKGLLFFGASNLPKVTLAAPDLEIFELLWRVFGIELASRDNLQLEMLRMLLKRWIILCIRVFKRQMQIQELDNGKVQLVREFNYLVEQHYRKLHDVQSYAALLHKSPKTLANIFSKFDDQTPLQAIQARLLQEARRLLMYTEQPIKEIAYSLGFEDIQAFSRFFSNKTGQSPTAFRERLAVG
jgi:AraC family transcriptional regulator, transcriptional activator of pobA